MPEKPTTCTRPTKTSTYFVEDEGVENYYSAPLRMHQLLWSRTMTHFRFLRAHTKLNQPERVSKPPVRSNLQAPSITAWSTPKGSRS